MDLWWSLPFVGPLGVSSSKRRLCSSTSFSSRSRRCRSSCTAGAMAEDQNLLSRFVALWFLLVHPGCCEAATSGFWDSAQKPKFCSKGEQFFAKCLWERNGSIKLFQVWSTFHKFLASAEAINSAINWSTQASEQPQVWNRHPLGSQTNVSATSTASQKPPTKPRRPENCFTKWCFFCPKEAQNQKSLGSCSMIFYIGKKTHVEILLANWPKLPAFSSTRVTENSGQGLCTRILQAQVPVRRDCLGHVSEPNVLSTVGFLAAKRSNCGRKKCKTKQ